MPRVTMTVSGSNQERPRAVPVQVTDSVRSDLYRRY